MKSVATVTPLKMLAVIPEGFKGLDYVKLEVGMIKSIDAIAYSVYTAKDKDKNPIMRKDGTPVTRTTAYIRFEDGSYTTTKYDIPIAQLVSETGIYPDEIGVHFFELSAPCKVKAVAYGQKFGDVVRDIIAFEPVA